MCIKGTVMINNINKNQEQYFNICFNTGVIVWPGCYALFPCLCKSAAVPGHITMMSLRRTGPLTLSLTHAARGSQPTPSFDKSWELSIDIRTRHDNYKSAWRCNTAGCAYSNTARVERAGGGLTSSQHLCFYSYTGFFLLILSLTLIFQF